MRVINPMKQQSSPDSIDFNTFNPLCKVQQAGDGSFYVKMMLHQTPSHEGFSQQRQYQQQQEQQKQQQQQQLFIQEQRQQAIMMQQEQPNDHPTLKKYIDGWLDFKDRRKFSGKVGKTFLLLLLYCIKISVHILI